MGYEVNNPRRRNDCSYNVILPKISSGGYGLNQINIERYQRLHF